MRLGARARTGSRWIRTGALLLAALGLCDAQGCASGRRAAGAQPEQAGETMAERLDRAIDLSRAYLVRACGSDGRFVYKTYAETGDDESGDYNMLRHAGALYALGMCQAREPDAPTRAALARGARYLVETSVGPVPGESSLLAVWSRPEIVGEDEELRAKLGGTGLGLVALLSNAEPRADRTITKLRQLALFLLYMQNDDGGFVSRFNPVDGRDESWTSLYYPGEAALGLLMLYEEDPQPEWLQGAADAIAHLARTRRGQTSVPADHWALIATARLLAHVDKCPRPVSRELLLVHARQVCESMLAEYERNRVRSPAPGCFTGDGRTTPTATRLEGLLAALEFLPDSDVDLRARIFAAAGESIGFLLDSQIEPGPLAGGVPRAIAPLPSSHPAHSRSFNRRAAEVRIDYVQHALSAMVQYREALGAGGVAKAE